jgi:flavin-dependent dehydrogenase
VILSGNRIISTSADILVIGAGPAGAAAARLLAAWGHDVVVIDRAGADIGRLAESVPPTANKILRTIGAIEAVRDAGFLPWRGNTVWWADQPVRVEAFPVDDAGYQVLRRDFDRCLKSLANKSGANVEDAQVTAAQYSNADGAWTVQTDAGKSVRARIVIDASGRAGVLARERLRILDQSTRTIALAGSWRIERRWPIEDESHTLVASYAAGWAWSVPVDRNVRQFTVMVDPSRSDLIRGASSRAVYLTEIAKVAPFVSILDGAELVDGPWGADASEYTSRQYAGPGFLLAGDAGSAINPLSSFGVKKALASGWLAAIAARTALINPAMADEAWAFFDRRERAVAAAAARQARAFADDAAAQTGHSFWLARSGALELTSALETTPEVGEPDATALARDPAVLAAFAELRSRPAIHLTIGEDVRIEPRPAVQGREIVMDDHVISPAWPDGLRYLRGVNLVEVLRLAPHHRDAGELFEAVQATGREIDLPNFLGALSVLLATGALRHS